MLPMSSVVSCDGSLYFDDLSPVVRELLSAPGASEDATEVEDADTTESPTAAMRRPTR